MRMLVHSSEKSTSHSLPTGCRSGDNALLAALSPEVALLLQRHFHRRTLTEGIILWDAGEPAEQIYFPHSGMISIRVPTTNGHGIEVATVGQEGAAGFQYESGLNAAITQAVVRVGGQFSCIAKDRFVGAAREFGELGRLAACCNDWLLLQAQQIATCNAVHSANARFCRWLLRASDAIANVNVTATQETIAEALGVRRTTATLIAQRLQQARVISYSRGQIAIRDREGLAAAACDCHAVLAHRNWPSECIRGGAAPFPRERHSHSRLSTHLLEATEREIFSTSPN
jgi:CRP-like cAMP-binding protein